MKKLYVFKIVQKNTNKHAEFQNILNPTYGNCIKNITKIIFLATSIIKLQLTTCSLLGVEYYIDVTASKV